MKKMLFLLLLLPLLGQGLGGSRLSAQTVTVTNLQVTEGSPSTVTFEVSWTKPGASTLWLDSAWVFVDYNKNGAMARLPVTGGALLIHSANTVTSPDAGKVIKLTGNDMGVWVTGDARKQGSFSATVQLFTDETGIAGACAYASGYPPVGEYFSDATGIKIGFTGTPPMYQIWLVNASDGGIEMVESGSTFLLPCSYTVSSFTDATGAPGIITCMPMVGSLGISGLSEVVKGQAVSFGITGSLSSPDASAVSYTWTAAGFSPDSEPGTAYAATAPAIAGAYMVTLTARSTGYCTETATQAVEVLDCTAPSTDIYALTASASAYCPGDAVTFALSGTTPGRTYQLYKDGTAVDVLTGTGGGDVFTGAFAGAGTYTARVEADGTHCAAPMTGVHVVVENPAPTGLSLLASTLDAVCAGATVTLTAEAVNGAEYSINGADWYASNVFEVSPASNESYTLYAKTAEGCVTSVADAAMITVIPAPSNLTLTAAPSAICAGEAATLTASADGGVRYRIDDGEWTTATTFSVTPGITTTYPLHVQTAAGCTASADAAAAVTVNPIPGVPGTSGGGTRCNSASITATPGTNGDGIRWWDGSTVSPRTVGTGTYNVLTTSAAGCESGTVSVSVTIATAGGNGQSSACGCVNGTIACGNVCRTNANYTSNDGACQKCGVAYVQQKDPCGNVINAQYSRYTTRNCGGPFPCAGDCRNSSTKYSFSINYQDYEECNTRCQALCSSYIFYERITGTTTCACHCCDVPYYY